MRPRRKPPGVDPPAPGRRRVGFGGARLAAVERLPEARQQLEVLGLGGGRRIAEQTLDAVAQSSELAGFDGEGH